MSGPGYGDPHQLVSAPVVVGVDGTPAADAAVVWAAGTATDRGRGLLIAHGMDLAGFAAGPVGFGNADAVREVGARIVASAAELAGRTAPEMPVETEVSAAEPSDLLVGRSASAHLVVIGGPVDRTGLGRLGSTMYAVTARAYGSVVVVRGASGQPSSGPVVVGVDGSPVSDIAVEAAFREAALRATDLVAVYAWSHPYAGRFSRLLESVEGSFDIAAVERAVLAERLAGQGERFPEVRVRREVFRGIPRERLLEWSHAAQLLVVGSRGRGVLTGMLLGSTSGTLIQRADCPVMVVRSPGEPGR